MRYALYLLLAASAVLAGCGGQPYVNEQRLDKGLVIVLPGIEGRSPFNEAICSGLDAGGVEAAILLEDWTSLWGPLVNLRAEPRNRRKAGEIAQRIAVYQWDYPDRPVVLVGQSGGGGMALYIAEAMPPGHKVDGIVLLAAAVSSGYTLDFALENSRRGIVSFRSTRDYVLGPGTALAGTMDGHHGASAGRVGFRTPATGASSAQYQRLYEIAWDEQMARWGHVGLHVTSGTRGFAARYVAPFARALRWDAELVNAVLKGRDTSVWLRAGQE